MKDIRTITSAKPSANMERLNRRNLDRVSSTVKRPEFDPEALRCGILHLGCGAFHRGHQAVVTQHAIELEGSEGLRWGIASASMHRPTTPELLRPQNGLYTVMERDGDTVRAEVIGSLAEIIHAPSDRLGLPARMADPAIRLVTMTVTANGYTLEPSSDRLNVDHPHVVHDLEPSRRPKSAVGNIVRGLGLVRKRGGVPPVIISCDNVSSNGVTLRQAVIDFAALEDDRLAAWIGEHVQFPCTMVDRIVPVTRPLDLADAAGMLGLSDQAPISAEPFLAWVIEHFEGERPRWERAGARFVNKVEPFELAKLRLLNGTHMLLAYVGAVAGHATIAEASRDARLGELARRFMVNEQSIGLELSSEELAGDVGRLMARLRNPAIRHEVSRIGRNGSIKLATRIMTPLWENLQVGRPVDIALLAIACWISWMAPGAEQRYAIKIQDPHLARLQALYLSCQNQPALLARRFTAQEDIFGKALPESVVDRIGGMLGQLQAGEIQAVMADVLNG
ncbi:mannitol dehydrogenase family protein [Frateuria aurantia]